MSSEWSRAVVVPFYKKGSASECRNYRPISLTSCTCKVMERIIVSKLTPYLSSNNIINKSQHGFLSKRSTCTNLLETLNDWTIALNDKNSAAVVYIDFAKAFDSVVHSKLCHKLTAYGIAGNLLEWIKNLLTNRKQNTRVGNSFSEVNDVESGVIQGSCIGPLLFLLFVNDLNEILTKNVGCKTFADDLKIYTIVDFDSIGSTTTLQESLDKVVEWSRIWQMEISTDKCSVMLISYSKSHPALSLFLDTVELPESEITKDLGIFIDNKLKLSSHIDKISAKAKQRVGLIFKCFVTRDVKILTKAYVTYVRPLLEYATAIWNPTSIGLIDKLESVQRQFSKRIPACGHLSYLERINFLNLETLEWRRLKYDLVLTYKIVFNKIDLDAKNFFTLKSNLPIASIRGHPYQVVPERYRINTRGNFFSLRVANAWNDLNQDSTTFDTISAFKNSLSAKNFTKYLRFVP